MLNLFAQSYGMRVIQSSAAVETIGHTVYMIRPSRHRSRRVLKKLAKRRQNAATRITKPCAYSTPHGLIVHPAIYDQMRRELTDAQALADDLDAEIAEAIRKGGGDG